MTTRAHPLTIHFCPFDKTCRSVGAPPRLHLNLFGWGIIIAFSRNARCQLFDWKTRRYGDRWGWVAISPPHYWTKDSQGQWQG